MSRFEDFIKKGKLKKIQFSGDMVEKEFKIGKEDLEDAKFSFREGKYKWATIQSYYALYHMIRSLVFKAGYREESHVALKIAFEELYIKTGMVGKYIYNTFERGMILRENADYKGTFSQESAEALLKNVEKSVSDIEKII